MSNVVIIVGGVSKGKFDYIPKILAKANIKECFHRVAQRPGKPLWFGEGIVNGEMKIVFGLPGNPVSSLVCLRRYVISGLNINIERRLKAKYVRMKIDYSNPCNMTYFVPVNLVCDENDLNKIDLCVIKENKNSGDFLSLYKTDGFIELSKKEYLTGELVPFFKWGNFYG